MNGYLFVTFVAFVLYLQAALYFLFFMPRNRMNVLFALFSAAFALYALAVFFLQQQTSVIQVITIDRFAAAAQLLASVLFNLLVVYMQQKEIRVFRYTSLYLLIPLALFIIFSYSLRPETWKTFYLQGPFWLYHFDPDSPTALALLIFVASSGLLAAIQLVYLVRSTRSNREQLQTTSVFVFLVLFTIIALIINVLRPVGNISHYPSFFHLLGIPLAGSVIYTLMGRNTGTFHNEILAGIVDKKIGSAMLYIDKQRHIVQANHVFLKLSGYGLWELQELDPASLFAKNKVADDLMRQASLNNLKDGTILEMISKHKETLIFKSNFIPVWGRFRNFLGLIIIGADHRHRLEQSIRLHEQKARTEEMEREFQKLLLLWQKRQQETAVARSRLKADTGKRHVSDKHFRKVIREKEELISEMHHRVKNNMQMIMSLANYACSERTDNHDNGVRIRSILDWISSIAVLHERFYATPLLSTINFGEYLRQIVISIQVKEKGDINPEFHLAVKDHYLSISQAIPCGIIAEELIVNAIRHAFPAGDRQTATAHQFAIIWIEFMKNDGLIKLSVRDNGVGIGKTRRDSQYPAIGLKFAEYLVIKHLNGEMSIAESFGTIIDIRFKSKIDKVF